MSLLTSNHRRQLLQDGYVQLPLFIPAGLLRQALRAINASIGKGMNVADMERFSAQSFCPELLTTAAITDLFNASPAKQAAEEAIGRGRVQTVDGGQVALRFPADLSVTAPPPPWAHIDGMYTPTNGVPAGTIANFTALAGILLSDLPNKNAGNLTVWPGSHLKHADYFRKHGPESLLEGMPQIDIGPPRQITGRAGDMVLAHYLLGHGVAPNLSPHIRYMCFFRLSSIDYEQTKWQSMCDPWLQWKGIAGGSSY
jgi:hypothetical protein